MSELLKFAKEGNADQVYAILDAEYKDDESLDTIRRGYENGYIEDEALCASVLAILYFRNGEE